VQAEAVVRFLQTGELPADDLQAELVLVNVEMDQLVAHKAGKNVTKAMGLFNDVAWRKGDAMEAALKKLCEMAKAGKLG
jgi:hypothetical protein